jgi:hypothetical protein
VEEASVVFSHCDTAGKGEMDYLMFLDLLEGKALEKVAAVTETPISSKTAARGGGDGSGEGDNKNFNVGMKVLSNYGGEGQWFPGQIMNRRQKKINGVEHASHYLSAGGHSNVRFHEDNVWTSCYKCNVMLSGNQIEYRKQLIIKIGVERVEWLEQNGSKEKKYSIEELKEIIKIYKAKCKELENI